MPYDEVLADRARLLLSLHPGVSERRMFGGVAFMVDGNMACGVVRGVLVVRVGPGAYDDALRRPEADEFDFTGRPMRGIVQVDSVHLEDEDVLQAWIEQGVDFVATLPPKG